MTTIMENNSGGEVDVGEIAGLVRIRGEGSRVRLRGLATVAIMTALSEVSPGNNRKIAGLINKKAPKPCGVGAFEWSCSCERLRNSSSPATGGKVKLPKVSGNSLHGVIMIAPAEIARGKVTPEQLAIANANSLDCTHGVSDSDRGFDARSIFTTAGGSCHDEAVQAAGGHVGLSPVRRH
jgi:hypothetical protein